MSEPAAMEGPRCPYCGAVMQPQEGGAWLRCPICGAEALPGDDGEVAQVRSLREEEKLPPPRQRPWYKAPGMDPYQPRGPEIIPHGYVPGQRKGGRSSRSKRKRRKRPNPKRPYEFE